MDTAPGAGDGIRTRDVLLGRQVFYQLNYADVWMVLLFFSGWAFEKTPAPFPVPLRKLKSVQLYVYNYIYNNKYIRLRIYS